MKGETSQQVMPCLARPAGLLRFVALGMRRPGIRWCGQVDRPLGPLSPYSKSKEELLRSLPALIPWVTSFSEPLL